MRSEDVKRVAVVCVACGALVSAPALGQQTTSPLASLQHVTITRDIDYVPQEEYADARDHLDVFMPEGARNAPVVVFFHGGELRYGSKAQGEYLAARLVPMGIGVVAANYRLSPRVMHPAHVQDAVTAVSWVLTNIERYGGDPGNVYVSGHSAGAYLAALMAVDDEYLAAKGLHPSAVRGWIPISPFLYVEETARDRPKTVWGDDPSVWLQASVSPYIGPDKGRWLLIYADGDDAWRREQNERFAAAMVAAGNPDVRVVQVPDRVHTSLITALNDPDDRIGGLIRDFIARGAPARP